MLSLAKARPGDQMSYPGDNEREFFKNHAIVDGAFGYESGTGGATVTPAAGARVQTISGYANGADGTIVIAGGDTVTVRSGSGFTTELHGALKGDASKSIVFSATMDYFVSWYTK